MSLYLGQELVKIGDKANSFIMRLKESDTPTPPSSDRFKFGDRITLTNYDPNDGNVYKATIVGEFSANDKTDYFAVLDAKWRSLQPWTKLSYPFEDTGIPNIGSLNMGATTPNSQYTARTLSFKLSEFSMSVNYPIINPSISATYEDVSSGSISIFSPNAKELQLIYDNREKLDSFDETLSENPNFKLSDWSFNGANVAWSCDELDQYNANYLNSNGQWNSGDAFKSNEYACLPIVEIPKNYTYNS